MVGFVTVAALVAVTVGFGVYYVRRSGVEPSAPRRAASSIGGSVPDDRSIWGFGGGSAYSAGAGNADAGGSAGDGGGGGGGGSW